MVSAAEALVGGCIQAAVGLADVSGINLDARPLCRRDECVRALLARLPGAVADEQRQRGVRLALQQFAHQLHAEKAGRAGDQDEFFAVHFKPASVREQLEGRRIMTAGCLCDGLRYRSL